MSIKILLFYLLLLLLLILRFSLFYSNAKIYKEGESVNFQTKILTDPKNYLNYQTVYVNIDPANKVLIKTNPSPTLYYGDNIKVSGNLKVILLKNKTKIYALNYPKIELKNEKSSSILAVIFSVRQRIINIFQNSLDQKSAGLMLGIVFGIKTNLPQDFSDQIKIAGVTHVIAASGMNVTMVCAFLFYLFSVFLKRQWAIAFAISGILIYSIISGFQASIIRAAIMGIIAFSAQALGRQQHGTNSLIITGFIMLFAFPQFLFDSGFQLSFASTLGLLYLPQLFKKFENSLTSDLITTLSAQISTLPILLTSFGNYSIFSVLVNALILWTVPILMILGGIAAIAGLIFEPLGRAFLLLTVPLLIFFEKVVSFFAQFGSTLNFTSIPWEFGVSYYLFLLSIFIWRSKQRKF